MARIRTIKPEFFTSEDVVSLTPLARVFYIALWCEADREGRLAWKPKTLKMRYLPGDECDVDALAQELFDAEMVVLYEVDGVVYAEIPSFTKHQVINNRESASTFPPRVRDASTRVKAEGRKGKEGKEGNTRDATHPSVSLFDTFWAKYPNKTGKDAARKAFEKRKPDEAMLQAMLQAIDQQSRSDQWMRDSGQYIPHPSTWLNQGRWMDEGVSAPRQAAGSPFAGMI